MRQACLALPEYAGNDVLVHCDAAGIDVFRLARRGVLSFTHPSLALAAVLHGEGLCGRIFVYIRVSSSTPDNRAADA